MKLRNTTDNMGPVHFNGPYIVVGNLDIIDRNNFKKLHIYFDVGDFSISVYYFFKFLYIALEKKLYSALLNASFN